MVQTNLDVIALMVVAALPEKPMVNDLVDVQLVEQRIAILAHVSALKRSNEKGSEAYLGDRSSKHNHFIELTNSLHELIHAWSLDHINVVKLALDLDRYREVGLVEYLTKK